MTAGDERDTAARPGDVDLLLDGEAAGEELARACRAVARDPVAARELAELSDIAAALRETPDVGGRPTPDVTEAVLARVSATRGFLDRGQRRRVRAARFAAAASVAAAGLAGAWLLAQRDEPLTLAEAPAEADAIDELSEAVRRDAGAAGERLRGLADELGDANAALREFVERTAAAGEPLRVAAVADEAPTFDTGWATPLLLEDAWPAPELFGAADDGRPVPLRPGAGSAPDPMSFGRVAEILKPAAGAGPAPAAASGLASRAVASGDPPGADPGALALLIASADDGLDEVLRYFEAASGRAGPARLASEPTRPPASGPASGPGPGPGPGPSRALRADTPLLLVEPSDDPLGLWAAPHEDEHNPPPAPR